MPKENFSSEERALLDIAGVVFPIGALGRHIQYSLEHNGCEIPEFYISVLIKIKEIKAMCTAEFKKMGR